MRILPLHPDIEKYLRRHGLHSKFEKQKRLFETNPRHPSLNTELMEPKHLRFFSFRVDKKYRALFFFHSNDVIEVIEVNNHYK